MLLLTRAQTRGGSLDARSRVSAGPLLGHPMETSHHEGGQRQEKVGGDQRPRWDGDRTTSLRDRNAFTHAYTRLHIWFASCAHLHVYIYLHLCAHVYIYLHIYKYIFTRLHLFTHLHIFTRVCTCLHIFTCLHLFTRLDTVTHVCVYLHTRWRCLTVRGDGGTVSDSPTTKKRRKSLKEKKRKRTVTSCGGTLRGL